MSSLSSKRNLILYVEDKRQLTVTSYNLDTKQIHQYIIPFDTFQLFLFIRSSINLNNIKAIAFILNENGFLTFTAAYNFRQKCYEFCTQNGIFYLFASPNIIQSSLALLQSKAIVKEGEEILVLSFTAQGTLYGTRITRKKYRYRILYDIQTPPVNLIALDAAWKALILGIQKPKKVILVRQSIDPRGYIEVLNNFFMYDNSMIISPDTNTWQNAIVETVLHFMGEITNQFVVDLPCIHTFFACVEHAPLFQNLFESLPFEKSAVIDVDTTKYVSLIAKISNTATFDELLKDVKLSTFKCKKVKVSLKVDINSFYDFKVEPVEEEKLEEKLSQMYFVDFGADKQPSKKSQLRFTQDEYYFVLDDGTTGAEKIPIYVSFAEKKPIIGKVAKELSLTKPEFVVYDIIHLCSHSSMTVINQKWKFGVSSAEDDSVMVTVKTVGGERQASPDFLLAMVIKDGINKIQHESNTTLNEIQIGFDGFIANKILKQNFEKAAQKLKINISFC